MAYIPLTKGLHAQVDNEDFEKLSEFKWHVLNGYAARRGRKGEPRYIRMHRLIVSAPVSMEVDHINGDRTDNRKENLRVCTHSENLKNRKLPRNNTSGYKGVRWHKKDKKWRADIVFNRKGIFIGNFDSKEEAAVAYNSKSKELFKEFSSPNLVHVYGQ